MTDFVLCFLINLGFDEVQVGPGKLFGSSPLETIRLFGDCFGPLTSELGLALLLESKLIPTLKKVITFKGPINHEDERLPYLSDDPGWLDGRTRLEKACHDLQIELEFVDQRMGMTV